MKRHIIVTAVQMRILSMDVDQNLDRITSVLDQIFSEGECDLVVFPEDCITGPIPNNLELALSIHSEPIQRFRSLAKKYKTYVVAGSFIQKKNDKYFNTSLLFDRNGEIILEYNKNNLWLPERKYVQSGTDLPIVKTTIGTIGIITCWDLAFPQTCNILTAKGADIICCPSYWTVGDGEMLQKKYGKETEKDMVNTLCPARAMENETLFIYANGAGIAEIPLKKGLWKSPQIGQSQICVPIYGAVKRIEDNSEGYISYQYDRVFTKDAEKNYKIRSDLTNTVI